LRNRCGWIRNSALLGYAARSRESTPENHRNDFLRVIPSDTAQFGFRTGPHPARDALDFPKDFLQPQGGLPIAEHANGSAAF
jgi:hypothetical protein